MGTTFAAAIRETGCRFQLKPNGRAAWVATVDTVEVRASAA